MSLKFFYMELIRNEKIEYEWYQRYKSETDKLRSLGFSTLHIFREVWFPLSTIPLFWLYPLYYLHGDKLSISGFLRVTAYQPLLFNYEYDSYASVSGLGTVFETRFVDGRIFKTYHHDIEAAWEYHTGGILLLKHKGRKPDSQLSVETYEAISRRGEQITMGIE